MTDKEIIKALGCCVNGKCFKCPLKTMNCSAKVPMAFALDLISRQQAEIERLKAGVNVDLENYASEYDSKIKTEAIKEFWEKLWELDPEIISKVVSFDLDELNNLKKEMVGK